MASIYFPQTALIITDNKHNKFLCWMLILRSNFRPPTPTNSQSQRDKVSDAY